MSHENQNRIEYEQSMKHYMASLIASKFYTGVVEYFEANQSKLTACTGDVCGEIFFMASKAYASLTHYKLALQTARRAQNLTAEGTNYQLQAEIFLSIGNILRDMSEIKEAEKAYRDAESIFRRNDCPEGQSRALNTLAGLFFRQNDYKNSLKVLMDAMEIARRLNDKKKLAFMLGNVGRIQSFIGNFKEAANHLKMNIDLSMELGDTLEEARAYLSLGYIHVQQAAYEKAEAAFEKAYPLIVEAQSERDEVIYLTYLGELQYRRQDLPRAKESLEKGLVMANQISPDSTLAGRVMRHLAELHLKENKHNAARRMASKSWVIMEKANDRLELGALTKIKAVLADKTDSPEIAAGLYTQAIERLDESGVRFEKADALIAAGCSDAFTPRQKLTYLFRAEEFYTRHNLERKIDEVEQLIAQTEQNLQPLNEVKVTQAGICPEEIDFVSDDPAIVQFKKQLPLMGYSDLPVLLTGETGVGKDHMARYFHYMVRSEGPFVAINCASLPETLLESELFGYEKGAFTGADRSKPGLFVSANDGVLFLDEIGDMPLHLQTKLLGVLENRKVVPLGSTKLIDLDFKLVAATNCNLEEMVEAGTFRRDLYYRLSGLSFNISALRDRKGDIPLLMDRFLRKCNLIVDNSELPSEMVRRFIEYDWPGNTRELFNKIKRLEVMKQMVAEGNIDELSHSIFSDQLDEAGNSLFERVEQFERKIITEALLAARGNKSEVARMLGIHEATVRTKLKRYGISPDAYRIS